MDFMKAKALLEKNHIKFVKGILVTKEKDLDKAKSIGFPMAMKIISKDISHKSDVGGVKLDIKNMQEAKKAFKEILQNCKKKMPKAKIDGIFVQKMIQGKQIIIGGKLDEQFGQTIVFGLGGIFVEVLKDVSLRICPIEEKDAKEMIQEIKGYPILKGIRGEKAINFKELEKALINTSNMLMKSKIKELDINPLIATDKEIIAVDVRVID
ncbi:MAG: acetate--CoA ligase family protein [archaeon]|nr:acetate--CoA ligase family protein [archaeon]